MDSELPNLLSLEDKVKNAIVELKRLKANESFSSNPPSNNSLNAEVKNKIKGIIDLIENNEHYIGDK